MADESPDINPYAAPADQKVTATADDSSSRRISQLMLCYQFFIANICFFMVIFVIYGLLTLFLLQDFLNTAASIPIHISVYIIAFYLARRHLRMSLARLRRDN